MKPPENPPEHHPFCNLFTTPVEGCKMCKSLFEKYPFTEGENLINKYFPDVIQRPMTMEFRKRGRMKPEHTDDIDCWCDPTIFFTSGKCNVLVHYGEGGETPTPGMLVAAIRLCVQNDKDGKYGNVSIEPKSESEGE